MDYDYLKYKKILIVDDEADLREMVTSILEQDGFKTIKTAGTVAEALKICRDWEPDLAILDVMLPDGDGFSLFEQMRTFTEVPVLFLTARGEDEDKLKGLGLGADDYITKPFGTSEMLARIRAAIRHSRTGYQGPAGGMTGVFEAKDLLIDYDKHRAYKGGLDLNLTQNEFRLVSLLSRYAGKVLTYDFMIREIWGPNMKGDNRILRVNMANIRRKIEKNPGQPQFIFTEVGVGYRIIETDS